MNAVAHVEPEAAVHDHLAAPMRYHPLADLFPLIDGAPFDELREDIRRNGLIEPIVLLDGMILDGRHRYLACREAGVPWKTVEFDGGDPVAFVTSINLRRRHLNDQQRAMLARKLANMRQGQRTDLPAIEGRLVSQQRAAELLNVSVAAVERASTVLERGAPGLVSAVEAGDVSLSAAAEVAKLPEAAQAEIVGEGPAAVREAAKKIRDEIIDVATGRAKAPASAGRKNPDYQPNPLADAARALCDSAGEVARLLADHEPFELMAALHDDAARARGYAALTAASDALSRFLEAANDRAA